MVLMPSAALPHVAVQSVLYHHSRNDVRRLVRGVESAARHAIASSVVASVSLALGDCSSAPVLHDRDIAALRADSRSLTPFAVSFFGENLGHGGGHARLASERRGRRHDPLLVVNPDLFLAPDALTTLARSLRRGIGAVELRQSPLEHPKSFDAATGATNWVAGAGLLIDGAALEKVGGFDHEVFPMYGDDVDLSWRLRAAGYEPRYEPAALGYHAKHLNEHGGWDASEFEWISSYEAEVMLRARWGSHESAHARLDELERSDDDRARTAATNVRSRIGASGLPETRTDGHAFARPEMPGYAETRFAF